jgi:hypothetical protein
MKTLIESLEEWNKVKGQYVRRQYHHFTFEDESKPLSYPCVLVESSSSIPDTYITEHSILFVYLTDF